MPVSRNMFDYQQRGPEKWFKWFMVSMIIYAVCTFWPESRIAKTVGGVFAVVGIGIARRQIKKTPMTNLGRSLADLRGALIFAARRTIKLNRGWAQ